MLSLQIKPRTGISASALSPLNEAKRVTAATLLLSGAVDKQTTADEANSIYENLLDPKMITIFLGASHVDLERFDNKQYWDIVEPFIPKHLNIDG